MSIQVCVCGILIYQDERGIKNSHLSYGGLPSALRSSKLIRCQSTRKQHSFLTFKGCLVDNIPGPGLKSIETLVDNDFPRKSIGFSGSLSRNLKSACSFSTFFMIGDSSITTGEALMAFLPLKGLSVISMTSMLV